jgi:hypothetical protein
MNKLIKKIEIKYSLIKYKGQEKFLLSFQNQTVLLNHFKISILKTCNIKIKQTSLNLTLKIKEYKNQKIMKNK